MMSGGFGPRCRWRQGENTEGHVGPQGCPRHQLRSQTIQKNQQKDTQYKKTLTNLNYTHLSGRQTGTGVEGAAGKNR